MAILFENYDVHDAADVFQGVDWVSQGFTPSIKHTITTGKVKMGRTGAVVGNITLSVRATAAGKPTGADIVSASIAGNDLPIIAGPDDMLFMTFDFGAGTLLQAGTVYAFVWRAPAAVANVFHAVNSANGYGGGNSYHSGDSGATWGASTGFSTSFQDWGVVGGPKGSNAPKLVAQGII
jgi:hypothetical protein